MSVTCYQQKKVKKVSCSVMSDSLQPHGLYPTRLLCPWDFPGKNTGVGCHFQRVAYILSGLVSIDTNVA